MKSKKIKTAVVSSRKNCQKADSPGPNNNAYTNVMAVWVLERALEILEILPEFNQERSDLLRHQALFDGIGR